jgi:hypothetical protein
MQGTQFSPIQTDPDDPPMEPVAAQTRVPAEVIQLALDTLAAALSDHSHQWTSDERRLYERATALLRRDPRTWPATPLANAGSNDERDWAYKSASLVRVVSVGKGSTPEAAAAARALIGADLGIIAFTMEPTAIQRKEPTP